METLSASVTPAATALQPDITVKPQKKAFLNYIHHFRGVAIIFVVAGHLLLQWPVESTTYLFFRVFWENGTVLFVFMAGYLFQHLSKKFEYKEYLTKKLLYVILPYLLVSIPIIFHRLYSQDYPGYLMDDHPLFPSWSLLERLGYFLLHGAHMQQLWFVPMIAIFYVLAPVMLYIDRNPKLYLILLLAIPVSLIVPREPFNDTLRMFAHFFSVYVFGMFMSRYKEQYMSFARKYWLLISVGTLASFVINLYLYEWYNGPLNFITKMLFCCFFIYWLWKLERFVPRFINTLATLSFGIFFVHYYVILGIRGVYGKITGEQIPGNVVNWLIYLVLSMGISVMIIQVVRKMAPKFSKYIIGV